VELSDLNQSEQEQHAFFLGLAALLGEGVYNLGELVSRKGIERWKTTTIIFKLKTCTCHTKMLNSFQTLHFTVEKYQFSQLCIRQYPFDFKIVSSVQYFIAAL
jgi:hypothetical protein